MEPSKTYQRVRQLKKVNFEKFIHADVIMNTSILKLTGLACVSLNPESITNPVKEPVMYSGRKLFGKKMTLFALKITRRTSRIISIRVLFVNKFSPTNTFFPSGSKESTLISQFLSSRDQISAFWIPKKLQKLMEKILTQRICGQRNHEVQSISLSCLPH